MLLGIDESPCSSPAELKFPSNNSHSSRKKEKNITPSLTNRLQPVSVCARAKLADRMHCEMIDGTFRWRRRAPRGPSGTLRIPPYLADGPWLRQALRCTPAILPTLSKDATGWNFPAAPIQRGPHPPGRSKASIPTTQTSSSVHHHSDHTTHEPSIARPRCHPASSVPSARTYLITRRPAWSGTGF